MHERGHVEVAVKLAKLECCYIYICIYIYIIGGHLSSSITTVKSAVHTSYDMKSRRREKSSDSRSPSSPNETSTTSTDLLANLQHPAVLLLKVW